MPDHCPCAGCTLKARFRLHWSILKLGWSPPLSSKSKPDSLDQACQISKIQHTVNAPWTFSNTILSGQRSRRSQWKLKNAHNLISLLEIYILSKIGVHEVVLIRTSLHHCAILQISWRTWGLHSMNCLMVLEKWALSKLNTVQICNLLGIHWEFCKSMYMSI